MKKTITPLAVALAVAASALTAVAPAHAASAVAAVKADAITTNYVVDPASPGPGVYCIQYMPYPPPAGWTPSQHWNNFVPRGYWASQIGTTYDNKCTFVNTNDGDGFWIDPNHHVSILKWAIYNGTTGAGDWFPVTSITGGQSHRFLSSGDYLLRVYNGAS